MLFGQLSMEWAAAADMWEWASSCSAPRGLVKSEADMSVSGLLSWRVRARTVNLAVLGGWRKQDSAA